MDKEKVKTAENSKVIEKEIGKQNGLITGYLVLYNVLSTISWSYVLYLTLYPLYVNQGDYTKTYDEIGRVLAFVQSAAVLEVLHVILGFVKSPLFTTVFQILSRIWLVWPVVDLFPEVRPNLAFTSMTIAWSITEIIRYSYYAFNLIGRQPDLLLWCRYTFFYLLYPIGAGSEAILIYKSLPHSKHRVNDAFYFLQIVILSIYLPGFYVMYTHMIKQRKKYLGATKQKRQ